MSHAGSLFNSGALLKQAPGRFENVRQNAKGLCEDSVVSCCADNEKTKQGIMEVFYSAV